MSAASECSIEELLTKAGFDGLGNPAPAFRRAMEEAGIETSAQIVADDRLHRVHVAGDRRGTRNGWYVLHHDDPPAGVFGSWKTGFRSTWHARSGEPPTPAERERHIRRLEGAPDKREEEEHRVQGRARTKAIRLWQEAREPDPEHAYLRAKGVGAHGIRQLGDRLLVPVLGADGTLRGVQRIAPDGEKRFSLGTTVAGAYHLIGTPADVLVISEGYATAATVHEVTGHAVAVAFNCGNLRGVVEALRVKFPNVRLLLAADNDRETAGNPGSREATAAAQAVSGVLAVPHFEEAERGSDFNDLATLRGPEAVRAAFDAALAQDTPRALRREIAPAEPYPVEALGPVLSAAVYAGHECTRAPLAICAQSVLGSATLAVQALADVVLPTGKARPLSLFLVTVAPTGERKTAADAAACEAIHDRERELQAIWDRDLPEFERKHEAREAQKRQILAKSREYATVDGKEQALEKLGAAPLPPLIPLLTCPEPTFEGLCRLLAGGYPAVGIFSSEGGQFLGGHGMNQDNRLKTSAALSSVWDGHPIRRVRAGDGVTILPRRRVCLHLMVQPGVADELLSDPLLAEQGLLSRLLVVAPSAAAGTRLWLEPSADSKVALASYRTRLLGLLKQGLPLAKGKHNELEPRRLNCSAEARQLWIEFHDHIERQLAPGAALDPIRGLANKLPEHAARIAGVLALFENPAAAALPEWSMAAGIEVAQHYATEALRLFEAGRTDPDLLLAERLLDWLRRSWRHPRVSLPDIYQRGLNAIPDAKTARRIANILERHGWLRALPGGAVMDGIRRQEAWEIVPHAGGDHA